MKTLLIKLLTFYQRWVSPMFPPRCRFQPTCSSYFLEAVQLHGAVKGSWLGIRRLLRCHPFHSGGYDPCPGLVAEPKSGCSGPHGHANTDNA